MPSERSGNFGFPIGALLFTLCGLIYAAELPLPRSGNSIDPTTDAEIKSGLLLPSQNAALQEMRTALLPFEEAARSALITLIARAYSNSAGSAEIKLNVEALAAAELRFATARAEAFATLQASTNKLNPNQVAMLVSQLASDEWRQQSDSSTESTAQNEPKRALHEFTPEEEDVLIRGEAIYKELCFACHGDDGKGAPMGGAPPGTTLGPPFAGSKRVLGKPEYVIDVVLHGLEGPVDTKAYTALMIPMAANDNEWIAAVTSYIRNDFGNSAPMITPRQVAEVRAASKDRTEPWTIEELYPEFQ